MTEADILFETENLYLIKKNRKLEIYLNGNTHAVLVGHPKDLPAAKRFMENAERYPKQLRKFHNHY